VPVDLTEVAGQEMVAVVSKEKGASDWDFITYAVSKELGWRFAAAVEEYERGAGKRSFRAVVIKRIDFEEGRLRVLKPPRDFDPDARPGRWILRCESSKTNDVWLLKDPKTFEYVNADEPHEAYKFKSIDNARAALSALFAPERGSERYVNWQWSILEWDDELGLAPMEAEEPEVDEDFLNELMEGSHDIDF
jgi:hypothetical protein